MRQKDHYIQCGQKWSEATGKNSRMHVAEEILKITTARALAEIHNWWLPNT
jgi:hypothetical protein